MWVYKSQEVTEEVIPEAAVGFIYIITNNLNGVRYIGKKLLIKPKYKMIKGKKKRFFVESDWKDYWGSSPYLLEEIETTGKENYSREILMFAFGKGELNYLEESLQYRLCVLESDKWFNSNIRSRIFKRNIQKYNLQELTNIVNSLI